MAVLADRHRVGDVSGQIVETGQSGVLGSPQHAYTRRLPMPSRCPIPQARDAIDDSEVRPVAGADDTPVAPLAESGRVTTSPATA